MRGFEPRTRNPLAGIRRRMAVVAQAGRTRDLAAVDAERSRGRVGRPVRPRRGRPAGAPDRDSPPVTVPR
jgi:hypothetical protein